MPQHALTSAWKGILRLVRCARPAGFALAGLALAAVPTQHEAHPVAARPQLAALAGAGAGLLDCFPELFRP